MIFTVFVRSCVCVCFFSVWLVWQQLLHPNPKGRHTPTAGRDHIHLRSTLSHLPLFHRPFRGARPTKDPGAPLLSAVYVCPSPWMPLGSGTARIRKTQRLTARMERCMEPNAQNFMHQNSPPGGHPSKFKAPQKRPKSKATVKCPLSLRNHQKRGRRQEDGPERRPVRQHQACTTSERNRTSRKIMWSSTITSESNPAPSDDLQGKRHVVRGVTGMRT